MSFVVAFCRLFHRFSSTLWQGRQNDLRAGVVYLLHTRQGWKKISDEDLHISQIFFTDKFPLYFPLLYSARGARAKSWENDLIARGAWSDISGNQ